MIRGIRGATTVEQDTTEAIEQAVVAMLTQIITLNAVAAEQIVTAFFTITPDITAISPARVARTHFPWQEVPMMCSVEPYVQGLPPRCIRILIQFESPLAPSQIHHVYLNDAVSLRPDRVEGS